MTPRSYERAVAAKVPRQGGTSSSEREHSGARSSSGGSGGSAVMPSCKGSYKRAVAATVPRHGGTCSSERERTSDSSGGDGHGSAGMPSHEGSYERAVAARVPRQGGTSNRGSLVGSSSCIYKKTPKYRRQSAPRCINGGVVASSSSGGGFHLGSPRCVGRYSDNGSSLDRYRAGKRKTSPVTTSTSTDALAKKLIQPWRP